jgi:pyrroloquinoline quinone biosynthesis protein D
VTDRPRLRAFVRLRFDEPTQSWLLLAPERGLVLNSTAAEVIRLLDGTRSLAEIVTQLASTYPDADADVITRETESLLERLLQRGLLEPTA